MDEVIRQYFDWDQAQPYFGDLARGFWVTLQIALLAELICLSLGMVLAVMRQAGRGATSTAGRIGGNVAPRHRDRLHQRLPRAPGPAGAAADGRQLPLPADPGDQGPDAFQIAFLALGIVYAAYIAEVYRAGIESVDRARPRRRAASA